MEVRCGKCNKLFRVSDDKITGSGVKFACSRCGEDVKITQEEFEQYKLSQETVAALASFEPKPKGKAAETPTGVVETGLPPAAEPSPSFDLSEPAAEPSSGFDLSEPSAEPSSGFDLSEPAGGDFSREEELLPPIDVPTSLSEPATSPAPVPSQPESKETSAAEMKPSAPVEKSAPKGPAFDLSAILARKVESIPSSEPVEQTAKSSEDIKQAVPSAEPMETLVTPAAAHVSSGIGKKLLVFFAVLVIITAAAFAGAMWYFGYHFQQAAEELKAEIFSDGLQITSATGMIAPENGDLVITGTIANTTTKPKLAWYIVAEVYNAQNSVIFRTRMLNGRQHYDNRYYEILKKRGGDIEALKKDVLKPGTVIPPKGTADFEIRIMEPLEGIASFNVALQPFDPIQVFKEMIEEKKQH